MTWNPASCELYTQHLLLLTMCLSQLAAEKYDDGERALKEAKRVEDAHEARLRNIHTQTEHLRQQEQYILKVCVCVTLTLRLGFCFKAHWWRLCVTLNIYCFKERMHLSHLQQDTERLRPNSSTSPLPQIISPVLPGEFEYLAFQ